MPLIDFSFSAEVFYKALAEKARTVLLSYQFEIEQQGGSFIILNDNQSVSFEAENISEELMDEIISTLKKKVPRVKWDEMR